MPTNRRFTEDELLKGEGVITEFNVFVGNWGTIGGKGLVDGEHGKMRVRYANLFFGHVRPRQIDGLDTYEGIRLRYVALPAGAGYDTGLVLRAEAVEGETSGHRNERDNGSRRKERPSKIGDPRYAGGTD
ncbi:MAG: hypothetical protein UX81_C0007G0010 [Parcubacteria group bacterium GW2011_GWA2_47_12]|uniref:Uncharacterized protein n=1 Tax=Candidatus Giovannonibacteria bacterium RIFCSPLOWO2_01_FULL_44_16 TaxID=1798348 RepID=A0A1F5X0G5_9BACT|nr:MAG: hypothetical protein UX81_C0007G0010 [Parcubacteria group bacterium GW2011_GWA2_47_12]OGF81385.1 MAG: hypothetical protein A2924_03225 [Candidatus Giovannonibacteria bacterium RIFCSPLOWO2_01_FULL_44_16]